MHHSPSLPPSPALLVAALIYNDEDNVWRGGIGRARVVPQPPFIYDDDDHDDDDGGKKWDSDSLSL